MFCAKCGKPIDDNAVTCPHCGYPVNNTAQNPVQTPVQNAPQNPVQNPAQNPYATPNYSANYPNNGYAPYYQPQPQQEPQKKLPVSGLGIAGFAVSMLSMGFGFLFCIPCLVGLILSSISYAKRSSHSLNGFALAGIIVGAVSFVFWLLYISIIGIAFFGFSNF